MSTAVYQLKMIERHHRPRSCSWAGVNGCSKVAGIPVEFALVGGKVENRETLDNALVVVARI
jgi:ADP-ribose pyrophosphatase YjhB (NUDIX family)